MAEMEPTPMSSTTSPHADPVLVARDVRRTFDADSAPVRALRGVDLTVRAGELVAVMGPSGCGKSTFIDVVAGLERPDAGSVTLAGVRLDDLRDDELARHRRGHVGIVFQFFNLIDGMTAHDNVALAALVAGASRRRADDMAAEVLDLLGLLDKAEAAPSALSGGLRQRLAIARALVNRPTLLLADEPTGALDSDGSAEVVELFARLNADGQTILLVTHDHDVAARAGRVVRMRDGRIVDDGVAGAPSPTVAASGRP
jgi:putative ABC transport system ATP-binding protein